MSSRAYLRGAGALVLAGLLVFSGCIFGPDDKDETPKEQTPNFLSLTDKENVIHNLLESYKWADIEHYSELLHNDYIWFNQPEDVEEKGLPDFLTRSEDIEITGNIFKARLGTHPDPMMKIDKLVLNIARFDWLEVAEIDGEPCNDCWETTRPYFIEIGLSNDDMTLIAEDLVKFTVVPVVVGDQTLYKIYRADDIRDEP